MASTLWRMCREFLPALPRELHAWGLYDMAGNVAEWCHDGWQSSMSSAAVTDPVVAPTTSYRQLRNASYWTFTTAMRAAYRYWGSPTKFDAGNGFRCARTLNP